MPKRGRDDDEEQGGRNKPKPKPKRREALYLVLDDWRSGYTIRKVNLLPGGNHHEQTCCSPRPLPKPFNRLTAPRGYPKHITSAFGARILAMHARDTCFTLGPSTSPSAQSCSSPSACCTVFPMLDVRSRGLTFGPGQRRHLCPIYLPVGTKLLFTLSMGAFEMLGLEERRRPPPPQWDRSCGMEWSWEDLPKQPFHAYDVASYSVHAEKHTFLVSTKTMDGDVTEATFAFDTVNLAWKLLGNWALPFDGRGHFDRRLEAFVGLSKDPDTFGQLCSCQAPSSAYTGHEGQCAPPPRLLCKEKLFSQDPSHRHVSATLVYMGRESKFCLVECLSIDEDNQQHVNEDE